MNDLKICMDRSITMNSRVVEGRCRCTIPGNPRTLSIQKEGQLGFWRAGGFLGFMTSTRTKKCKMSVEIAAMNTDASPSELVVTHTLRNTFPHFLMNLSPTHSLKKFLGKYLDIEKCPGFRIAS